MKKNLSIIVPFIIIIGISFMSYRIFQKFKKNNEIALQINHMPEFEFANIRTGASFRNHDLLEGIPSLIIYFSTECEHCQFEISEISKNIEQFNGFQIVMVSIEEPNKLTTFFENYKRLSRSNVFILYDKKLQFEKIFGQCPFPTSFIYNSNMELVKVFKGEVKIAAILKYLND